MKAQLQKGPPGLTLPKLNAGSDPVMAAANGILSGLKMDLVASAQVVPDGYALGVAGYRVVDLKLIKAGLGPRVEMLTVGDDNKSTVDVTVGAMVTLPIIKQWRPTLGYHIGTNIDASEREGFLKADYLKVQTLELGLAPFAKLPNVEFFGRVRQEGKVAGRLGEAAGDVLGAKPELLELNVGDMLGKSPDSNRTFGAGVRITF